ncbi:MAG TPA: nuclear transport factor 2 family protein [Solirubrobacteraceae bacterium]|nr:nuclear transport factor 2 family protein [Solirubrobacteraceae bacterium]
MSRENVEIVRGIYDGWSRNDPEMMGPIDPAIEVYPDPRSAWPGIESCYRGHEGLARYLASIYDAFSEYRAEVEDIRDAGDQVVTLAIERGRGKQSGVPVYIRHTAHIWTLRDGRAVRLDVNWDRDEALRAVGLREQPVPGAPAERRG